MSSRWGIVALVFLAAVVVWLVRSSKPPAPESLPSEGPLPASRYAHFETGHMRPLALSTNGSLLYALNTPADLLEVFDARSTQLKPLAQIPVGMRPIALAVEPGTNNRVDRVWVVNTLSDSVSVVEVELADPSRAAIVSTLQVGDEPQDIVFAGRAKTRAFVTTARRGQNLPRQIAPELTTPSVPRALLWVFDSANGNLEMPISVVQLFGDAPGALAASQDGECVFITIFNSGNATSTVDHLTVAARGGSGIEKLVPEHLAKTAPKQSLIVQFDSNTEQWRDETGRDWTSSVLMELPDDDVFALDAESLETVARANHIGSTLFAIAPESTGQRVLVAHLEANNLTRLEPRVQGHFTNNRITEIDFSDPKRILKGAVDLDRVETGNLSLALPTSLALTPSAKQLLVGAMGSNTVSIFDLQENSPSQRLLLKEQVRLDAPPTGILVGPDGDRAYVMSLVGAKLWTLSQTGDHWKVESTTPLAINPVSEEVQRGQRLFYDAVADNPKATGACASCHIFGKDDGLAWDLGNPTGEPRENPNPFSVPEGRTPFHPLKGPMVTQRITGLAGTGPLHWRGDRTGGLSGHDPLDERAAFALFNGAFVSLLGRSKPLNAEDLEDLRAFSFASEYPPSPVRSLDNRLTEIEARGQDIFLNHKISRGTHPCEFCHRGANGTVGLSAYVGLQESSKVPQLRGLYAKVGRFGIPPSLLGPGTPDMGAQVRGFGFLHDGTMPTIFDFLHTPPFASFRSDSDRRAVESFLLAFDTGLAPIIGQQLTLAPRSSRSARSKLRLMVARARAGECALRIVGRSGGTSLNTIATGFHAGRIELGSGKNLPLVEPHGLSGEDRVTFTCLPPDTRVPPSMRASLP